MNRSLLLKELVDIRVQVLFWSLGLGFMCFLTVFLFPSVKDIYSEMFNKLPDEMIAFVGAEHSVDTLEGYLNVEFFTFVPIALAVFAVISGTGSIRGDENQGTLGLLLAQPVSRLGLFITRILGLVLANGFIIVVLTSVLFLTSWLMSIEVSFGRILVAFGLLWMFLISITALSVLVSLVMPTRVVAGTFVAVWVVVSHILNSLSEIIDSVGLFKPVYLTAYFQGGNALGSEISVVYLLGLAAILIVSLLLGGLIFVRRGIAV